MMEILTRHHEIASQYANLTRLEPYPIDEYVPVDAAEQKRAFLAGDIRVPHHQYAKLDAINFDERATEIKRRGDALLAHPDLDQKHTPTYEAFIKSYEQKNRWMQLAYEYNHALDPEHKSVIAEEYKALGYELYGAPQEEVYRSLLHEKIMAIKDKNLMGEAARMRGELFAMVDFDESREVTERFKPSADTIGWMHSVVETLYEGMLSHVPDQKTFTVSEVQAVFQAIIKEEFGEAAEDWRVDVGPAKSINVKSTEKRILIPEDRDEMSKAKLRQLIVHEIGVHMLRSVMGGETDLDPLKNGLDDYYDTEEGLAKVMEQALDSKFVEAGIDHYITAGLIMFEGKDFRDVFEIKWRLAALAKADKESGECSEEVIVKAREAAYNGTMRLFRGTDDLPWFKDLAYYNGSVNMWRHMETICGDDIKFMFALLGKGNPLNSAHERAMYESASI